MPEAQHRDLVNAATNFLLTDAGFKFTTDHFVKTVLEAL
jgi:hypothetical protein